jgi:hypothetical protein
MLRWSDADVDELGDGRAHVRIGSGSNEALLRVVTWLAGQYAVVVREPDELVVRVDELVARLRR